MPDIATHFIVGNQIKEELDSELAKKLDKGLYELGLQGPDFLYHYKPLKKTHIRAMGDVIHNTSGFNFFGKYCDGRTINNKMLSYLVGYICHYALDVICHPLVNKTANYTSIGHRNVETDLDFAIFEKYKIKKDRRKCVPVNIDYELLAEFYGFETKDMKLCHSYMKRNISLLRHSRAVKIVDDFMKRKGNFICYTFRGEKVHYANRPVINELLRLVEEGRKQAPVLIKSFLKAVKYKDKKLLVGFEKDFNGI